MRVYARVTSIIKDQTNYRKSFKNKSRFIFFSMILFFKKEKIFKKIKFKFILYKKLKIYFLKNFKKIKIKIIFLRNIKQKSFSKNYFPIFRKGFTINHSKLFSKNDSFHLIFLININITFHMRNIKFELFFTNAECVPISCFQHNSILS